MSAVGVRENNVYIRRGNEKIHRTGCGMLAEGRFQKKCPGKRITWQWLEEEEDEEREGEKRESKQEQKGNKEKQKLSE